jgi:hypothetical protein
MVFMAGRRTLGWLVLAVFAFWLPAPPATGQYSLDKSASKPKKLVFESEHFENLDSRWRARETHEIRSPDEFVETFELAAPGKELQVYSRNSFKRIKR